MAPAEMIGRYQDGEVAVVHAARMALAGDGPDQELVITAEPGGAELARWPAEDLRSVHSRARELRVGRASVPGGGRVIFTDAEQIALARDRLPALGRQKRRERTRQVRTIGIATGVLGVLILGYVYGVPLMARQIVGLIPPQWEEDLGDTVVDQLGEALAEEGGLSACDPDPNSLANRAIDRFVDETIEGSGTPFDVSITVVRTGIPNAFALPGGRAFYFDGLLANTEDPDEFAGVMAHEIGHVVRRHGMEQLISTAGTGLLVGFLLGDMTGISVAAAVGSALIDTGFSRDAEREADYFAADTAQRLGFRPTALADLLDRVAEDDAFSRALALLSTHPLTDERRAALEAIPTGTATQPGVFTAEEWSAIRAMCDTASSRENPSKDKIGS
jgi:predicted Zn-dependent protease